MSLWDEVLFEPPLRNCTLFLDPPLALLSGGGVITEPDVGVPPPSPSPRSPPPVCVRGEGVCGDEESMRPVTVIRGQRGLGILLLRHLPGRRFSITGIELSSSWRLTECPDAELLSPPRQGIQGQG